MSRRVVVEADGGSRGNPGPAGYGAVVRDADTREVLREVAAGIGVASNNVAEYRGLIAGLEAALDLGAREVDVRMDSLLVVNQMSSKWKVKHEAMKPLASQAAALVRQFDRVAFGHIPRELNGHADRLANEAMDAAARGLVWAPRTEAPGPDSEPAARRASARDSARDSARTSRTSAGAGGYGWGLPQGAATGMLLLRHGETAMSVEKRFSGSSDPSLSDRGRAQAEAAARRLAGHEIAAVVSSPRQRCRETAAALADLVRVEVVVDDGVVETDFGAWEGYTFAEVQERWPNEMAAWLASPDAAPPEGESFTATFARVGEARARLTAAYSGRTIVVVSHVTPIKAMVREALEAPPHALFRLHLEPASLTVVDWYAGGAGVVRRLNDTAHLGNDIRTR